ncbi:MAG: poly-gamma-glutamate biosynthesis protein PgsC [Candidatus Sumerlaeia bacterium]|nr:poly-gamma-glutamate biosynthesis protein PgsC [Candidatus Sumerlaeia bacterium]
MVTIFVVGILVALLVEEWTGLVPGGIIVPAFLAMAWNDPTRLLATLAAAGVVYALLLGMQRIVFLYGRRRFAWAIVTGVVIKQLLAWTLPGLGIAPYGLLIVGFLIPGLMAETCARQGVSKTIAALVIATVATRLLATAILGVWP